MKLKTQFTLSVYTSWIAVATFYFFITQAVLNPYYQDCNIVDLFQNCDVIATLIIEMIVPVGMTIYTMERIITPALGRIFTDKGLILDD